MCHRGVEKKQSVDLLKKNRAREGVTASLQGGPGGGRQGSSFVNQ